MKGNCHFFSLMDTPTVKFVVFLHSSSSITAFNDQPKSMKVCFIKSMTSQTVLVFVSVS